VGDEESEVLPCNFYSYHDGLEVVEVSDDHVH